MPLKTTNTSPKTRNPQNLRTSTSSCHLCNTPCTLPHSKRVGIPLATAVTTHPVSAVRAQQPRTESQPGQQKRTPKGCPGRSPFGSAWKEQPLFPGSVAWSEAWLVGYGDCLSSSKCLGILDRSLKQLRVVSINKRRFY